MSSLPLIAETKAAPIDPIGEALRTMLPADIAVAAAPVQDAQGSLFPAEEDAVRRAMPTRIAEFKAGRTLARDALGQLRCGAKPIPRAGDRRPMWPTGYLGSISHTRSNCAAAAARSRSYAGLGIDLESNAPLAADLHRMICRPEERTEPDERIAVAGGPVDPAKLRFVVKECLFKAFYPATRIFMGFHDAHVVIDPAAMSFEARIVGPIPHLRERSPHKGSWRLSGSHIVAALAVRRTAAIERLEPPGLDDGGHSTLPNGRTAQRNGGASNPRAS